MKGIKKINIILTCLLKQQDNIEHDDIHTSELLPDLKTNTEEYTIGICWLQDITITMGSLLTIKANDSFNFFNFLYEKHKKTI